MVGPRPWDEEGGQRFSHASPIIRAHEAGWLAGLTQYGIRSLHTAGDNIALARSRGARIFWCEPAKDTRVDDLVEVAPQYDGPGQLTALHGARLILDTVGAVFRRRAALR